MKIVKKVFEKIHLNSIDKLSDTLDDRLKPDKWKLLYQYSVDLYKEEVQRFNDLDNKSSKLLTALSIVILIYLPSIQWGFSNIDIFDTFSITVFLAVTLISGTLFLKAWFHLYQSFRLSECPKMTLDEDMIKIFKEKGIETIHHHLQLGYKSATQTLIEINELKSQEIKGAFKSLGYGFLMISIIFYIELFVFSQHYFKGNDMSQNKPQPVPELTKPPKLDVITRGGSTPKEK